MKLNLLILVTVSISSMFLCSGCASIICGSEKTINVTSSPIEAQFAISNAKGNVVAKGLTPTNVTLKRGSGWFKAGDYTIKLSKVGYKDTVVPIAQGIEGGWYGLGNIVFGGLIGWVIVDPLTGAMYNIKDVNVSLLPVESAMLYPDNRPFLTIDQIPEHLRPNLVRIN